jgi:hypothetical protein
MRTLLIVIAIYQGANGAAMLVAPEFWYGIAPGADHTGPINIHFIRDIGLAFLAAAAALVVATREDMRTAALIPALVFLGGHAGLHVVEMIAHGTTATAALRDLALIVVPAFLPLLALRTGEARYGRTAP